MERGILDRVKRLILTCPSNFDKEICEKEEINLVKINWIKIIVSQNIANFIISKIFN